MGYTEGVELERQTGRRASVGISVGFLAGLLRLFLSFAALFNGAFFLLLLLLPAYALSGAFLVWLFRLPPIHAALSPCNVGSTLGGLVVAGDHFELRVARVVRLAGFHRCDGWNESAWCVAGGCQAAS